MRSRGRGRRRVCPFRRFGSGLVSESTYRSLRNGLFLTSQCSHLPAEVNSLVGARRRDWEKLRERRGEGVDGSRIARGRRGGRHGRGRGRLARSRTGWEWVGEVGPLQWWFLNLSCTWALPPPPWQMGVQSMQSPLRCGNSFALVVRGEPRTRGLVYGQTSGAKVRRYWRS
jgi:hypothetical protein